MPVITSVKPQKNQKRINIYLDDVFGFGIDLENFVKFGLKVGREFSEHEIEEIVKKAEFQKVYDKILRFATLRPRSKKEFEIWLKKYKVHESLHHELFNRLKHLDLLNDKKFANWWVEQRTAFRPKGKNILKIELLNKGIDKEIISLTLSEVKIDEVEIANSILQKKKAKWQNLHASEARQKMAQFLFRRGFDWEVIKKVLK